MNPDNWPRAVVGSEEEPQRWLRWICRWREPRDEVVELESLRPSGDKASRFTISSGILEKDEVVVYDERPHWWYSVVQFFKRSSLIALAFVFLCLLTPWTLKPLILLAKVVGCLAAGYWICRQEVDCCWTHYVVTDVHVYVITRPWAIFGAEYSWSLKLGPIETMNVHRPMIVRLLGMNVGHLRVDAPGQQDQRFHDLRWVRRPKHFRSLLKPGSIEVIPTRAWWRWARRGS